STVKDHARPFGDDLQPPRPARRCQPLANRILRYVIEQVRRCHGKGRIRWLIVADESQTKVAVRESRPGHAEHVAVPTAGSRFDFDLLAKPPQLGELAGGLRLDDFYRLALAPCHDAVAALDDRRLLA